jgi:hypothetical protein
MNLEISFVTFPDFDNGNGKGLIQVHYNSKYRTGSTPVQSIVEAAKLANELFGNGTYLNNDISYLISGLKSQFIEEIYLQCKEVFNSQLSINDFIQLVIMNPTKHIK